MRIADFDYALPDALIARYPAALRRESRMLEVGDALTDRRFADLPLLLRPNDLLVFNDTRVIPARLTATKDTGGKAELLIERVISDCEALAQIRASKSPKPGRQLQLASGDDVVVTGRDGEFFRLRFGRPVGDVLAASGEVPLPPYIEREAVSEDAERYQTVYAREPGAVAAPTAGLHFDRDMLEETREAGATHAFVTLHVGAGTFQPLRRDQVADNRLHSERVVVSAECRAAVHATRAAGGRVIAVGTTAVRSLESACSGGALEAFDGETDLFIYPGYRFRVVDAMLTNFHLPKSSLLMLVAAFAGRERTLAAYAHAVRERYRFFSYGDCMFVTPGQVA